MRLSLTTAALLAALALAACTGQQGGGTAAHAIPPSFDCGPAKGAAERAVCADDQLGALDRELARTYALARADKRSIPSGDALQGEQAAWVAARDDCGGEGAVKACLVRTYAERIQQLRLGSAMARSADDKGIAHGPFTVTCEGVSDPLTALFLNADPGLVYLSGPPLGALALEQAMSASGARYADPAAGYEFWNKGNEATFQRPGVAATTCTLQPLG